MIYFSKIISNNTYITKKDDSQLSVLKTHKDIFNSWSPETKNAARDFITILDPMFTNITSIGINAGQLALSISKKNKFFGTSHLQQMTKGKENWLEISLSDFKSIVSEIMNDVYKSHTNYYDYINHHGKKELLNTFYEKESWSFKGIALSTVIGAAKKGYTRGIAPLECCYPKQHGRLLFATLLLLSWVCHTEYDFNTMKKQIISQATSNEIKQFYPNAKLKKLEQKRFYLDINKMDNVLTEWAKAEKEKT